MNAQFDSDQLVELFMEMVDYHDMKDLLAHLRTFFDGRADAETFNGLHYPNHDMRILVLIDEALEGSF